MRSAAHLLSALLAAAFAITGAMAMQHTGKYDDGEWHLEDAGTEELATAHLGFLLTFIVQNDLHSDFLAEDAKRVADTKQRETNPVDIIVAWDLALVDDMMSDEGNAFLQSYYYAEEQSYLLDYVQTFGEENVYKVEPDWTAYDRIRPVLQERLRTFRES